MPDEIARDRARGDGIATRALARDAAADARRDDRAAGGRRAREGAARRGERGLPLRVDRRVGAALGAAARARRRLAAIATGDLLLFDFGADRRRLLLRRHAHVRDGAARRRSSATFYDVVREANATRRRRGPRRDDADGMPTRSRGDYIEERRDSANCSGTGWATGSAWRCTKRRVCRKPPTARCRPGRVVTIEPGIYRPGGVACASRTTSCSRARRSRRS